MNEIPTDIKTVPGDVNEDGAVSADVAVKVSGNTITVAGANGSSVAVYSAAGALVEKIAAYNGEAITLESGVYVVRVGNKSVKVKL